MKKTLSKAELSRELGVTRQAVDRYCKRGMPVDEKGRITLATARAWLKRNNERYEPKSSSGKESLTAARTRKESALAALRELERDREAGRLVDAEEINRFVSAMIINARDALLRIFPELRDRLAQESDPNEVERMGQERVNAVLNALADSGRDLKRNKGKKHSK